MENCDRVNACELFRKELENLDPLIIHLNLCPGVQLMEDCTVWLQRSAARTESPDSCSYNQKIPIKKHFSQISGGGTMDQW